MLFTLPIVSEKISQNTERLRLKKFRKKKKKKSPKELARSIHDICTQLLSEIEKASKTAWGLRAHKFSLIFGLLPLKVSGREVKGDSQPCDR